MKLLKPLDFGNASAIALVFFVLFGCTINALADENVRSYHKKDGKFVEQHKRSSPDGRKYNNYSSEGNTNPYTGKRGHKRNELSGNSSTKPKRRVPRAG